MADMPEAEEESTTEGDEAPAAAPAPRRGPGHRAADARDTAAEMAQRAHEISLEAGSKMAGAMREVIGAAAGFSAFAIESARDLIHYMVRRGQMGHEEAEVLIQQAEAAYIAKHGSLPKPEPKPAPPKPIPLGQMPKAVAAPAAAAERALEARATMRLEPQRPSDKGPPLILRPPTKTAAPKVAAAPAEKAPEKKAEKAPAKAAKPATKPAAPAKAEKPAKAVKAPAKAPVKAPVKAPAKAAKPVKSAKAAKPAKAPAKAPAKKAAKKKK